MLRPEFTSDLANKLMDGAWINLISAHGQGRRRTLADLRRHLPASLPVVLIDLKLHAEQLPVLLSRQSAITGPMLLVIHNFHLLQSPDLIGQLQELKKIHGLSLLVTSEVKCDHFPLDTEDLMLPPLQRTEIANELQRRGIVADSALIEQIIRADMPCSELEMIMAP
ncbi:hypothetical protein FE236_06210 [Mariprofundus erugo]|uniref:hypothetical protein n=1 Tax=Mariprofundus erugo TaxID=2528639 RepID=UPI0010FE5ADC|nr:hypothetical protein [Mariprofundus erugo]TLS76709.1 hypothetical protein FE236_06210 [Mariprofundus erugo]